MKVLIVFYSRYGNTLALAEAIAQGAREAGAEVALRRTPDLASPEVVARDQAWTRCLDLMKQYPEPRVEELPEYDALVFGCPTRYGNMPAELKLFLDKTGPLWVQGKLVDKVTAVFCTNSTAHSGNESTLLTMMVPLLHHGMLIVGVPPTVPETARAGSYYGATAVTGGGKSPTADDLAVARALGRRVAQVAGQLHRGRGG